MDLVVATAVTAIAIMSLAATAVVVKSETVDEWMAVPDAMLTPLVLITSLTVGMADPVATFQNLTVIVPLSPGENARLYALIVHAKGTVRVALLLAVVSAAEFVGSPIGKTRPRACTLADASTNCPLPLLARIVFDVGTEAPLTFTTDTAAGVPLISPPLSFTMHAAVELAFSTPHGT